MTTTTPTPAEIESFCELLRTVDPAVLNRDDLLALIDLLGRTLAAGGVR